MKLTETTLTPADLAAFQHRVPGGLKAPGQPVLMIDRDGSILLLSDGANMAGFPDAAYWTREPVEPPRPALPTAHRSVILNLHTKDGEEYPVAFRVGSTSCPWVVRDGQDDTRWLPDDEIVSFDYARIVPNGTGVMDEEDKSPVVDCRGNSWKWSPERELWSAERYFRRGTKAAIAQDYGPLRPASEKAES